MSERPTDEEYAAAIERDRVARDATLEANQKMMVLLEESIATNRECIRLSMLRRDLEELLVDDMTRLMTSKPWTVKRLADRTYRPVSVVQAALDKLVTEGRLRQAGKAYEVTR